MQNRIAEEVHLGDTEGILSPGMCAFQPPPHNQAGEILDLDFGGNLLPTLVGALIRLLQGASSVI